MKSLKYLFFLSFFLISCKNPLKESVLIPLDEKVILKQVEKDTTFSEQYHYIRRIVDSVYVPAGQQAKIKEITYKGLINYLAFVKKERDAKLNDKKFLEDWTLKFGKFNDQYLKDSLRYEMYIDSNLYQNYVKLDFIKAYEEDGWIRKNRYAEILITPINGNIIRSITGYLMIIDKGKKDKSKDINGALDGNAFFSTKGYITKPTKDAAFEISNNLKLLDFIGIPKEIILQKFDVMFEVNELIVKDRYIDVSLEKIPFEYKMLRESNFNKYYKEYYIKNIIDSTYLSKDLYVNKILEIKFTKKFNEEYKFFNDANNFREKD